jgi:hypothetical protein
MNADERQALREKHTPQPHTEWFPVCATCITQSPCDVIKVLDELDQANFQAAINYERGYDDGFRASVADAEWDHWADGVSDDQS